MPDWKTMKLDAKVKIKTVSPLIYLASFIYVLIWFGITLIEDRLNPLQNMWMRYIFRDYIRAMHYRPTLAAIVLDLIIGILLGFLTVGFVWYSLKISRNQQTAVPDIFDAFKVPLKVLWLSILMNIFVILWSILLVIPGFVAIYRYSQAYNILYDHPDYSAMQCIRESKRMMHGYKAELFGLDFSFLGWTLLGILTFGILFIWLTPYMYVTRANFYNALCEISGPNTESDAEQNSMQ